LRIMRFRYIWADESALEQFRSVDYHGFDWFDFLSLRLIHVWLLFCLQTTLERTRRHPVAHLSTPSGSTRTPRTLPVSNH
jgi:hypothetical protein